MWILLGKEDLEGAHCTRSYINDTHFVRVVCQIVLWEFIKKVLFLTRAPTLSDAIQWILQSREELGLPL